VEADRLNAVNSITTAVQQQQQQQLIVILQLTVDWGLYTANS